MFIPPKGDFNTDKDHRLACRDMIVCSAFSSWLASNAKFITLRDDNINELVKSYYNEQYNCK